MQVAGAHEVNHTAKALPVNYYALKKRVERQAVAVDGTNAVAMLQSTGADCAATAFLELAPRGSAVSNFIGEMRAGFLYVPRNLVPIREPS